MLARLLGFLREVVIGYQYGTSYQADSIITAFTIPNFIYLVVGGAITTAFISVYSKLGEGRSTAFMQTIFSLLCVVIGSVTLSFMVFPDYWMAVFFSGMPAHSFQLTSKLFLWMAPSTFFLVIGMWLSGVLNVHERYQLTAVSTLLFNGMFVAAGVVLYPWLDAFSYGIGATVGSIAMVVLLLVSIWRSKLVSLSFSYKKMPEMKRFFKLALPILFGGATIQFYFFIQRIFATNLENGAIAALNYASKMTQFPQAVLMTAVTTVIYPMLAKTATNDNPGKLEDHYQKGIRWLCILLLPATGFVYFYAKEIIAFIFEYGNFTADSTNFTYPLLQIFAWSMFGLAVNMYVTRFFYALENAYLPVLINVLSVFGVNILVIYLFLDEMGARAIALGTTVSTIFNMVCMVILAKQMYHFRLFQRKQGLKLLSYGIAVLLVIGLVASIQFVDGLTYLLIGGITTALAILIGFKSLK